MYLVSCILLELSIIYHVFFRQEDLHQVLKAYSLYDTDVGYCQVLFLQEIFSIVIQRFQYVRGISQKFTVACLPSDS